MEDRRFLEDSWIQQKVEKCTKRVRALTSILIFLAYKYRPFCSWFRSSKLNEVLSFIFPQVIVLFVNLVIFRIYEALSCGIRSGCNPASCICLFRKIFTHLLFYDCAALFLIFTCPYTFPLTCHLRCILLLKLVLLFELPHLALKQPVYCLEALC